MKSLKQYLTESPTSELAARMGLSYFGFGKYGKDGEVTHIVRFGRLVPIKKQQTLETSKPKLTHLEHVEDEVFSNGVHGVRNALNSLHSIRDYFKHKGNEIKLTQKVDGSPSTVISNEPGKKPYVATKSAFAATPKLNYSHSDIEKNHPSEGLQQKMKAALDHLPKAVKGGTFQGDLLYTHHDIKVKNIDGKAHYVFKPNVITYAVPVNSELGRKINKSKIGIVIHTQYDENGKATYDPDMSNFTDHPDTVVMSNDMGSNLLDLSPQEEAEFEKHLSAAGKHFQSIPHTAFEVIEHPKLKPHFKTYVNSKVRDGKLNLSSNDFLEFMSKQYDKKINSLKSESAIDRQKNEFKDVAKYILENEKPLNSIFKMHSHLNNTKMHLLSIMNKHQLMKSFLDKDGNLEPLDPEGYVVATDTGALKLVNRLQFSKINFEANK